MRRAKPTTKAQRHQRDQALKNIAKGLDSLARLEIYLPFDRPDGALGAGFARPMDDVQRALSDMRRAAMRDDIEGVQT